MLRFLSLAAALLTAALIVVSRDPTAARPQPDLASPAAPGEVLVRLKPAFDALSDETLSQRLGGPVLERLAGLSTLRLGLPDGESPRDAVARLQRSAIVDYVEPNHLLQQSGTPNDPLFAAQSTYLDLIQAPAAWDIEPGDDAVMVAVLDSGINLSHPDLQGRIWTNPLESAANGIDDDINGCIDDVHGCNFVSSTTADSTCPAPTPNGVDDDNGHGTFISGIIAASANNGIGGSGAAPGISILPVKILDCLGAGTAAEAAQGILYAARTGARVANISFGAEGESQTLAAAINEAHDRYNMVIVAASGNAGTQGVSFPARLPAAIAVGSSGTASDPNGRSLFSNWGPEVAFVAPGLNVVSTVPPQYCGVSWSCPESTSYATASGTSFAAPFVSALAALLISHTPNLSPQTIRQIIASTAEPLPDAATPGWDGAGRIRMRFALDQQRYTLGAGGIAKQ